MHTPERELSAKEGAALISRAHEVREAPAQLRIEWEPACAEEHAAMRVVSALREAGGEAYFVGGYARDLAMRSMPEAYLDFHFEPHDIDIVTSLPPDRIESVLEEAGMAQRSHGKSFQVCQARVAEGEAVFRFEVAAYRMEGTYSDGRRPDVTEVTRDIREDIARRDFTMNALLFDPDTHTLIDYSSGLADLQERRLAFIGSAAERISEDALRMFRYVRFRARYKLGFDTEAGEALRAYAEMVEKLPGERVKQEFDRILTLRRSAFAVADLARFGLLERVLPDVSDLAGVEHTPPGVAASIHAEGDVFAHTLRVLRAVERPEFHTAVRETLGLGEETPPDEVVGSFYRRYGSAVAWALLLHDIGKKDTQEYVPETDERPARYAFHAHEKRGAELFDVLAAKCTLPFSLTDARRVHYLLENHLEANRFTKDTYRIHGAHARSIWKDTDAEALLFVGLADTLGNYKKGGSPTDALLQFRAGMDKLHVWREEEARAAWIHEHASGISSCIMEELERVAPARSADARVLMGPLKHMALARMRVGALTAKPEELRSAIREMVALLAQHGLINASGETRQSKKDVSAQIARKTQAQELLAERYHIHPADVL